MLKVDNEAEERSSKVQKRLVTRCSFPGGRGAILEEIQFNSI